MRRGPSLGRVPAAPVPRRLRYYACATTPCTASPRLISSPAGTTLRLLIRSLSPAGRGGPGPFVSAGGPCSGARTWTVQGLPGSLASHPVALRTFFDPGRSAGASPLAAPPMLPPLRGRRRHQQLGFRGSIASLHHPLCTLHDMRYRTPCNTRSRLAGSASAGRVSNPLARGERFQLIASSFPGLALAQPLPPQNRACASNALGSSHGSFALSRRFRLSMAVPCTGCRNSSFRPVSQPWPCTCDAGLSSDGSRRPRFPAVYGTMPALRPPARRPLDLFLRQPVPRFAC